MPHTPKHPIDKAYVSDDGDGLFGVVIGFSETGPNDSLVRLNLKPGTTVEEASTLARSINERLRSVILLKF